MSEDLRSDIAEPVIEVGQLRRRYGGQRSLLGRSGPGTHNKASRAQQGFEAVRGVDLQVERGELFALLGTNGAGKTSTVELIKRGHDTAAAAEIGAVRKLAEQSGHDVGQLVRGFQNTSLETELAGARSLLDSAGIRCVVSGGAPADLKPNLASALVWILRESVTNVIRHSKARECFITLDTGDPLRLIVTNDGAGHGPATPSAAGGSGLVGMSQRLIPFGGALTYGAVAGRFTVEAVVPARRPQVLEVPR